MKKFIKFFYASRMSLFPSNLQVQNFESRIYCNYIIVSEVWNFVLLTNTLLTFHNYSERKQIKIVSRKLT